MKPKIRPFVCLVAASLLFPVVIAGAGDAPVDKHPALAKLEGKIRETLKELCPDAAVNFSNQVLSAAYRTQKFMIHTRLMTGEIDPKPHEEIGPGGGGFLLSASIMNSAYPEQHSFRSGPFQAPYWSGYYDRVKLNGSDEDVLLVITYGARADTNVVAKLRACVSQVASENK